MARLKKALDLASEPGTHKRVPDKVFSFGTAKKVSVAPELLRTNKIVSSFINAPAADAYKLLRTRVIHRMRENNWKTIGVTSPNPRVGKTLTSINLAIALAMEPNHSALVVDTDLRRPNVHRVFGLKPEFGLVDYLTSDVKIDDILLNPGIEGFDILPCRESTYGTSELLTSSKMSDMVHELKNSYSSKFILFDLPPIYVADDVLAFSKQLDAMLLVVEDDRTRSSDLEKAMEILEHTPILGVVLNKAKEMPSEKYMSYYPMS